MLPAGRDDEGDSQEIRHGEDPRNRENDQPRTEASSPSQLARQSSFGPSTPPTHHLKQQLSVLRAEVSRTG